MLRIALYEPDIPQNVGAIMRLAACFKVAVDIIEPCGFVWFGKSMNGAMKRVAMDYINHVEWVRHADWQSFYSTCRKEDRRLVLLTVQAENLHYDVRFTDKDVLLLGRETSGAPQEVHNLCDMRVRVPMAETVRSLNMATATAVVLSEAVRQIGYGDLR